MRKNLEQMKPQNIKDLLLQLISLHDKGSAKYKQLNGLMKQLKSCNSLEYKINDLDYYFIQCFQKSISHSELSQNSKFAYWNAFKRVLEEAYKMGLTSKDLSKLISSMKQEEVIKDVLTDIEISLLFEFTPPLEKKLIDKLELIKDMAKISLYSGLRFSDIQSIDFDNDISNINGSYLIRIVQQKTKKINTLHLHNDLLTLLHRYKGIGKAFVDLDYHNSQYVFKQWACIIDKKVTFHTFRHTFAMKLHGNGVDLITISNLLGHKNVNTTQNYVKCLDVNKSSALLNLQY